MANQHLEPDDASRWEKASGMTWPHQTTLRKARVQHQDATEGQTERVREVQAPTPGAASERPSHPVWNSMGAATPRRPRSGGR